MIPDDFRRIALSMPRSVEVHRHGHSKFRVERKTFATLEGPADSMAFVRFTPEQQATFVTKEPAVFVRVSGHWGRLGTTWVHLAAADEATVRNAISVAWANVVSRET